jgi:copper chaperone CopZ
VSACPVCSASGRRVEAVTIAAQVTASRLAQVGDQDGWRTCSASDCEVVYFHGADVVRLDDALAVPFHKSGDPQRLVCFCFGHSVADVEADARAHGTSTIQASIAAACKAGLDDCERKNPQGRCCLGNVGGVVKSSLATLGDGAADGPADSADPDGTACCAPKAAAQDAPAGASTPSSLSPHSGLFAAAGALVAALLASACCWLPLAAVGLGASAAGAGALFAQWRTPLLLVTAGLLGVAFYLVYRQPRCAPGDACEVPRPGVRSWVRRSLWGVAGAVAAFALFPVYAGALTGGGGEIAQAAPQQTLVRYHVDGMTCAGCEAHAREAIETVPGVASAAVSYRGASVEVAWRGLSDPGAISRALATWGYRVASAGAEMQTPRPSERPRP